MQLGKRRRIASRSFPSLTLLGAALLAGAWSGCGGEAPSLYGDPRTSPTAADLRCTSDATIGVPTDGRPTSPERLALYAADRARAEPGKTGWPDFPSVPPLLWHSQLGLAALAHSADMRDTPCFQHTSCDGTDPFVRIKTFVTGSYSSMGENIAAGVTSPIEVVEQSWINERGAAPGEDGHRKNMFDKGFDFVGFGYAEGGNKYKGYWTQDFATGALTSSPRLAVGAHYQASNGMTFGTVYFDGKSVAPDRVEVVVDSQPTALSLTRGARAAGAYEGTLMLGPGCHRYYFRAATADGVACYPGAGTLGASMSGADCADYSPDR